MKFKFKLKEQILFFRTGIKRMIQRNIERDEVEQTFGAGKIIEEFIF